MAVTQAELDELAALEAEGPTVVTQEEADELAALEADTSPSALTSSWRGAAQGGTFGKADEIAAGVESVAGSLGLVPDKTYDQSLQESRQAFQEARSANPKVYDTSKVAGEVGSSLLLGGLAAKGGVALAGRVAPKAGEAIGKVTEMGEELVNKIATRFKVTPETVKDIAETAVDYTLGGPYSKLGRVARRAGKAIETLRKGPSTAKGAEEEILDKISKKMSGWDFPVRKK